MGRRPKEFDPFDITYLEVSDKVVARAKRQLAQTPKRERQRKRWVKRSKDALKKLIDWKAILYFTNGTLECPSCCKIREKRRQWIVKRTKEQDKILQFAIKMLKGGHKRAAKDRIILVIKHTQVVCKSCYMKGLWT